MTQIAADALGVAPEQVTFELGSTDMPENPASTGSVTAASTGSAVHDVAMALRQKLVQMAIADARSPLHGAVESNIKTANGRLIAGDLVNVDDTYAALLGRNGGQPVEVTVASRPGAEAQQYSMHSFGAVFTEVRVSGLGDRTRAAGCHGARGGADSQRQNRSQPNSRRRRVGSGDGARGGNAHRPANRPLHKR